MEQAVTDRQRDVLDAILVLTERRHYPPTVRELCEELGVLSSCTVQRHLDALERKGYITREPQQARTLRVVRRPSYA